MKIITSILMALFLVLTTTQCKEKSETKTTELQQEAPASSDAGDNMNEDNLDEDNNETLNQMDGTHDKTQS